MPTQHRFRLHQEAGPSCSRQSLSQHTQDQAIARLPARTLDLPFEHPDLLAESQHFRLQACRVLALELD
jgi:hypothetical protein